MDLIWANRSMDWANIDLLWVNELSNQVFVFLCSFSVEECWQFSLACSFLTSYAKFELINPVNHTNIIGKWTYTKPELSTHSGTGPERRFPVKYLTSKKQYQLLEVKLKLNRAKVQIYQWTITIETSSTKKCFLVLDYTWMVSPTCQLLHIDR